MISDDVNKEYWRLLELENCVEVLEEAFGAGIEHYKTEENFATVQIRAYAYSIVVMKEIICLLKNGFPDGALARARRLYEQLMLIDFFNNRKLSDDFENLIKRYCDSQNISAYENRIALYDFFKDEELKKDAENKLSSLKEKYKRYIKEGSFAPSYWWTGNAKYKSFNSIQKEYDEPFAQILYRRACISTHASAIGDFAMLGRNNLNGEIIYTGRTQNGFSTPLILATLSYYEITSIVFVNLKITCPEVYLKLYELIQYYQETFFDEYSI